MSQNIGFSKDIYVDDADDNELKRISQDKYTSTNMFGKSLISMSTVLNLSILNGTCNGDSNGSYTFVAKTGCFVVDYFIIYNDLYAMLFDDVILQVQNRPDSKHLPVSMKVKFPKLLEKSAKTQRKQNLKSILGSDFLNTFLANAYSIEFHKLFHNAIGEICHDVNKALGTFNKCIKDISICMEKKVVTSNNRTQNGFTQFAYEN